MKTIIAVLLVVATATSTFAHSKLNTSLPADGSIVQEAPQTIELKFGKKIRLTKVEVTDAKNQVKSLELGDQKAFGTEFFIPFIGQGSGEYEIEWRGLGVDGHAMKGAFSFKVE